MESPSIFAVAVDTSEFLDAAIGLVCQDLGSKFTESIDLAMVFASGYSPDEFDRHMPLMQELLKAKHVMGCNCETAIAAKREYEGKKCLTVWIAHLPGTQLLPMHLDFERNADGGAIVGWPDEISGQWPAACKLLAIGEPFGFPMDGLLERFNEDRPDVEIIGGMASGAITPDESRLLLNAETFQTGAVVIRLSGSNYIQTVVSQGCRPIGEPMVVTQSERNVIFQLGGEPALVKLKKIFDTLPTREQRMVEHGLQLGRVISEYQENFEYGDFLIRNVVSFDPDSGAIVVADYMKVGQTVQFHIRDHETATAEMQQLLVNQMSNHPIQSALLFTCNGRGTRMFPEPNHDAELLSKTLGADVIAGLFAAGEIGSVGGKNFLHGFTASIALFSEKAIPCTNQN